MSLEFKNGKFKIMQVSDPQDMHYPRRSMLKMLDKAYDTLKPDLVVFTGDNVLSNHLLDARFGNKKVAEGYEATKKRMKESLRIILEPLEKRGIPFAMIFDMLLSYKFNKKTGIFSVLLYIPVIFTLFYVVLGIAKVLPWHPGWLLILFGILVDFIVVGVRLLSGTKVKEEDDKWSED